MNEIGEVLGLTRNAVRNQLRALADDGLVRSHLGAARRTPPLDVADLLDGEYTSADREVVGGRPSIIEIEADKQAGVITAVRVGEEGCWCRKGSR